MNDHPIMRNLLLAPPPRHVLCADLAGAPKRPIDVGADGPQRREWLSRLAEAARADRGSPLPTLDTALYARFRATGERLTFDRTHLERRARLAIAALPTALDPSCADLLPDACAVWSAILDEPSWALSAHVPDPSGIDPTVLDLKACETAVQLAELIELLGERAPPELVERTRARISAMIEVFLAGDQSPWGWFRCTHNWNAVTHQGIVGAALLTETDPDRLAQVLLRMAVDLPRFLDGYGPDGGCSEGATYWEYGFGFFARLNEQIERRTAGRWSLFHDHPRIAAIARFGVDSMVGPSAAIAFGDGIAHGRASPALLAYLGGRLADPVIAQAGRAAYAAMIRRGGPMLDAMGSERIEVSSLLRLFAHLPSGSDADEAWPAADAWYPDLQWWTVRGAGWAVSAKCGHNDEHHNHCDVGSFVVHRNGIQLIAEAGMPEYVMRYFHGDRSTFLAARSWLHSVPHINGCEQRRGAAFRGRVIGASLGEQPVLDMDLAGAYPADAQCRAAARRIAVDRRDGSVELRDRFTLALSDAVESPLICAGAVTRNDDGTVTVTADGQTLRITPLPGTVIDRIDRHELRLRDGSDLALARVVLTAAMPFRDTVEIGCRIA